MQTNPQIPKRKAITAIMAGWFCLLGVAMIYLGMRDSLPFGMGSSFGLRISFLLMGIYAIAFALYFYFVLPLKVWRCEASIAQQPSETKTEAAAALKLQKLFQRKARKCFIFACITLAFYIWGVKYWWFLVFTIIFLLMGCFWIWVFPRWVAKKIEQGKR